MTKIVEVVYPKPEYQHLFKVNLELLNSYSILEVIKISGILDYYPEIDLAVNKVGINSEIKQLSDLVKPLDRVEIYRPLVIDPMAARRLRAKRALGK